jgi:CMP-N,N'-diacetyllegionaminic acid synthase
MTSLIGLIPARAHSSRLPGKHTKKLGEAPLLAYTIAAAQKAACFDKIMVCSDSKQILQLANEFKVDTYVREPSRDDEPDIDWVRPIVTMLDSSWDAFAILRATSPFRTVATINWAWNLFTMARSFDSIRAVTPVSQHPGKMWTIRGDGHLRTLEPLLLQPHGLPWHSSPSQTLPPVYVQTAGLEIAWLDTVRRTDTIAGEKILALELDWPESLDINTQADWIVAEELVRRGLATLPEVS